MTDLSEESAFGAGRNASAVWPRPVTVKRLSSFRPGGQERPRLAEAAGLLGRFRLTRLRGCWREEDRPRAPQTIVGEGRVAWAPPLGGSLLGPTATIVELRNSRLAGLIGPIQRELFGGARKHVHELRVGR